MNNPNVDVIIYNIRKPQSACESAYSAPGSACSERPSKGCLTDSVSPRIKPTFGLDIQGHSTVERDQRRKHALCEAGIILWEALMIPVPGLVWEVVKSGRCVRYCVLWNLLLEETWT